MAGMDYDGIAGIIRMIEAGEKPNFFAVEVITYHAAIESELERIIAPNLLEPDALFRTSPKLGFGQKANLLRAFWRGKADKGDTLVKVLKSFNNLRNAVAHADNKEIKGCHAGLTQSYRAIDNSIGDEVNMLEVSQGICLFMQDGTNVSELNALFDGLAKLVNEDMPRFLGVDPSELRDS